MDIIDIFLDCLEPKRIATDEQTLSHYGKDWLEIYPPNASCILFPVSNTEVQAIVQRCNEHKLKLIPSGGRTGLSGGAAATEKEVVLSLDKLNKIIAVNETDRYIHCQAGVTTEQVKKAAEEKQLFYPIDFGASGSSQIGGNIATNAGGMHVIQYGCTRDWVLGLTVVTGAGEILELNGPLYKNQSGYDFRSLFIGSEGTLGVITEAILKLSNAPDSVVSVFCGVNSSKQALELLEYTRKQFSKLMTFEYLERNGLEKVIKSHSIQDPFSTPHEAYVLLEVEEDSPNLREELENFLSTLMDKSIINYVVMSQNQKQSKQLMSLRELLPETLAAQTVLYKNDLSVPISDLPAFIEELKSELPNIYSESEVVLFGHLGDGNIHLNILKPTAMSVAEFKNLCETHEEEVFKIVQKYKGSISAEHGVGLLKREHLSFTRSEAEIELMRKIKSCFDPNGIMNPGKIFTAADLL